MKSQRKPVEIFSFSFLDVIACAVGVILFITILAISQSVSKGDPELLEKLEESRTTAATLERMKNELVENKKKQNEMQAAQKELVELKAKVNALKSRASLSTQYESMRQQYELAKANMESMNNLADTLPARSPVARSTNKKSMVYLSFFGNDKVRIAARSLSGDFYSDDYDVKNGSDSTFLTATGGGHSVASLTSTGGQLKQLLEKYDPLQDYIECYVEADAFEDFVRLRNLLQAAGWDVGFMFIDDASELAYSSKGTSSKIQ